MRYLFILFLAAISLGSCDSNSVYQDYNDLEESFWHRDSLQSFSFEITDSSQPYDISATFRNSASYPFYNLYFQYTLLDSAQDILVEDLKDVNLFDPKTGEPRGSGLGDLFDHEFIILDDYQFPTTGQFTIRFEQYMRKDTLPLILSVGAKVEFSTEQ